MWIDRVTRLKAEVERQSLGYSSAIQFMIGLTLHGYRAGYHLRDSRIGKVYRSL